MTKIKKVLLLLISMLTMLTANEIGFKELTSLVSKDTNINIYLDKDIKDYKVDFNIVDYQTAGEIYEFYKIVLFEHNMILQYNKRGKFYFIKQKEEKIEPKFLDPLPLPYPPDEKHYYSYKIRNITNNDVVKVMSIFKNISYTYLEQSDIIAYSATEKMHKDIKRMLHISDNSVVSNKIKITLFTTNKTKIKSYGSKINSFSYNLDSSLNSVLSAFKHGTQQRFNIKDTFNLGVTLMALQSRGLADVMQEPTVLVTNGVRASVNYVKTVAYLESSVTNEQSRKTTTNQLKYRDIGFRLNVLPKIKKNWVYLDLDLISEELLTPDSNNVPVTQKISYKNSLKVYRGKPILLTGLKKSLRRIERSGIPILKDIPIIGELFKGRKTQSDEQNINILIEVL